MSRSKHGDLQGVLFINFYYNLGLGPGSYLMLTKTYHFGYMGMCVYWKRVFIPIHSNTTRGKKSTAKMVLLALQ